MMQSSFFRNKGAVAGVFLVVGIAGAAILLFLFFAYRRRRRVKQNERDAAIAASLGPQSRVPFEVRFLRAI
jgi:beta-lactamase regulating signal transducer with metallopeptidase domain